MIPSPADSARLERRSIDTDVLVVGGGTAGAIAALSAAGEGARVVLLEQDTYLGGIGTRGGIHLYWYGSPGGLQDTVDRACRARTQVFGSRPRGFHPEAKRSVLAELALARGVQTQFGALVCRVLVEENAVRGVVAETPEGTLEVRATITIDATGDGDVAAAAGAAFTLGRSGDSAQQCYSLVPRRYEAEEKLNFLNFDDGWVDALDPWDVSRALVAGRARLADLAQGDRPLLSVSPQLGVRESRHVLGEYVLTFDDVIRDRHFSDVVFRGFSHYDNHALDFGSESDLGQIWAVVLGLFRHGLWFEVPYRCLVPQRLDGLLVACRALSLERDASMPVRMQREMQKAGDAAGVAAALCARDGIRPRDLDVPALQQRLVSRGLIKETDLHRSSAPAIRFDAGPLAGVVLTEESAAQHVEALLTYLPTEEQGKALWWLWQVPDQAAPALARVLADTAANDRAGWRAAALGLGLLGRPEAVPALVALVDSRDPDVPAGKGRAYPRWIGALTLLRIMRAPDAYPSVLRALHEEHPPMLASFFLRYLDDVRPHLDAGARHELAEALVAWAARPDVGEDYAFSGGRTGSLRWSLVLRAAAILGRLGDSRAGDLNATHLQDARAFVRSAAQMVAASIGSPTPSKHGVPEAPPSPLAFAGRHDS